MARNMKKINGVYRSDFRAQGKRIREWLTPHKESSEDMVRDLITLHRASKNGIRSKNISRFFFQEKYFAHRAAICKPHTLENDKRAFNVVLAIGRPWVQLDQMSVEYMQDFIVQALKKKMRMTTIKDHLRRIKTAMKQAEDWDFIGKQAWEKIPTQMKSKKAIPFTPEQFDMIVDRCTGHWRTAAMIMGWAGLRSGELRHLEWDDIDFKTRLIHIREKDGWVPKGTTDETSKEREVDLFPELELYLKTVQRHSKWVFYDPAKMSRHVFGRHFTRLSKPLGFKVYPHKFRHTFASFLISSGSGLPEVAELLGHSELESTQIYSHLLPKARRHAVDRMQTWRDKQREQLPSHMAVLGA